MDSKEIRQSHMKLLPHMNEAVKSVQKQLSDLSGSDFILETNIKPHDSVKRKMEERRLRNIQDLSDLVRGRLYFSDQFTFKEVMGLLTHFLGAQIKNVEKKDEKEHGLIYKGIMHVDLNVNGLKFELQVLPIEFHPHKETLHKIYEQLRSDHSLSDKQKETLRKIHNKMIHGLDELAGYNRSEAKSNK